MASVVNSCAVCSEGVEDVIGGLRPDERLEVLVPLVDLAADVPFEFGDAALGRAAEFAAVKLDEVESPSSRFAKK